MPDTNSSAKTATTVPQPKAKLHSDCRPDGQVDLKGCPHRREILPSVGLARLRSQMGRNLIFQDAEDITTNLPTSGLQTPPLGQSSLQGFGASTSACGLRPAALKKAATADSSAGWGNGPFPSSATTKDPARESPITSSSSAENARAEGSEKAPRVVATAL
eukprot:CAMPEP_0206632776 /NCGR_PEP_ID=MMETSP0325_2-20121206/69095_1 /ASSEMBLY_ACC=CAM_ASM_000347 /TAXON_ID=2866 /ORGANISM="Crypthecodinium cohnii, Strain Seligo" /LENGTH=160 /DNA_ID=CAMNT_0054158341 /DNA_START=368 /DNA_END=853 /DNA_ORIENTATION=+